MTKLKAKTDGFTIIELLIAMTVFSMVMLMLSMSIIQITRVYYKGLTNAKTQETARTILQDVSQNIQFNGGNIPNSDATGACVGDRRYSYTIGTQVNGSARGLVADTPGSCTPGSYQSLSGPLTADSSELLIPKSRLAKFSITRPDPAVPLYKITVRVVYGDDDLLVPAKDSCKVERAGTEFCAVSELSTTVQQRVQ